MKLTKEQVEIIKDIVELSEFKTRYAELEKAQELFESITCLCVEGPEFHTRKELMESILREAEKGYGFCKGKD